MPLQLKWVGEESYERIAEARMRCYAPAANTLPRYIDGLTKFRRAKPGDFLLAERDGEVVGTTTSLSLHIHMRGGRIACQGVAYVGTIKTARRLGDGEEKGIASQLMIETIRKAREREQPISALMPFRASYYEHFGYGNAEHRAEWTIPLAILPRGDFAGYRFYRASDLPQLMKLRQAECERGQCDIETSPQSWELWMSQWPEGMVAVDDRDGQLRSFVHFTEDRGASRATLEFSDWCAPSPQAMLRLFYFAASLKDQYSDLKITLPGDYPLNRVLRETQIPHRQVDHPVAAVRPFTRMQIRILDHKTALEAMKLPMNANGKIRLAVNECEGTISRFVADVDGGRIAISNSDQSADVELSDVLWASIVSGDITASKALQLGLLAAGTSSNAIELLDSFSVGPAPFCQEYF
jgi:predicted acetyltransferase